MKYIPLDRVGEFESYLWSRVGVGRMTQRRDAIAALLGLHGLRIGEVCAAQSSDFSPAARVLSVRTLKGGKPRDVRLSPELCEAVCAWRSAMGIAEQRGPLLPSVNGKQLSPTQLRRSLDRFVARVFGPHERRKFHALRHTAALIALRDTGKDVMAVKKYLGHRSLNSTAEYLDILDELPASCTPSPSRVAKLTGWQLRVHYPDEGVG